MGIDVFAQSPTGAQKIGGIMASAIDGPLHIGVLMAIVESQGAGSEQHLPYEAASCFGYVQKNGVLVQECRHINGLDDPVYPIRPLVRTCRSAYKNLQPAP